MASASGVSGGAAGRAADSGTLSDGASSQRAAATTRQDRFTVGSYVEDGRRGPTVAPTSVAAAGGGALAAT